MSTRATICFLDEKNKLLTTAFCHFDGYIQHTGKILKDNYSTPEKAFELVDNGAMNSIKENINDIVFKSSLDAFAWSREYGKNYVYLIENEEFKLITNNKENLPFQDIIYVFYKNEWLYFNTSDFDSENQYLQHLDWENFQELVLRQKEPLDKNKISLLLP